MKSPLQLQFSHQPHQARAVDAVVKVFDGQPLAQSEFALAGTQGSVSYAGDGSIGNALLISDEQLLANVQQVQQANGLSVSDGLEPSLSDDGKTAYTPFNFTLEMETGTGKTYTFIKTIYELNKIYGFKKFVVVVPSVAIREGAIKNLEVTRQHFAQQYANVPLVPILYNSDRLTDLRDFAQSDALSVLVINIDSFAKDSTRIKQKGEKAFAPIDYIQAVRPIVIVDEPQNFETDIRRRALQDLNPLCTLRYSATLRNRYNLLYVLNPVQAYDLGLVKQIEVEGVQADADSNQAFMELIEVKATAQTMTAKVRIDVNEASGIKRKEVKLRLGDDLYEKSRHHEVYAQGYILNEFLSDTEIEFSGGRVLRLGQQQGGLADEVMRFQIERTVAAHFAKAKRLHPMGIKVLSLFFIDRVANYRTYDEQGKPMLGKLGEWFEAEFAKCAAMPMYQGLIPHSAGDVHNGYFSGDKKGKGTSAQTVWVDTSGNVAKDDDTYALIMRHKERLLRLDEPLQFLFSHSALREGWDNPNVFQICTLNETQSAIKKRQEIGRGLRLCVNQSGCRVEDKKINVLTVIPNQSYAAFAQALQQEIEDETGVQFSGRVQNARAKARIQRKPLSQAEEEAFMAIWQKINYQTRYGVHLDSPELIERCASALQDLDQYPKVQAPKIRAEGANLMITEQGVLGVHRSSRQAEVARTAYAIPDVYAYIQNKVHLSRSTVYEILTRSGRLKELLINPQGFLDLAISAMKNCLQALMVEGIEYHVLSDHRYEMSLFDEDLEAYLTSIYPPIDDQAITRLDKTLLQARVIGQDHQPKGEPFECVLSDSRFERQFAHDCTVKREVKFFFKLPSRFKIATPLGGYNPDWAVVIEKDQRVCFVAETKSTTITDQLRPAEKLKIECGRKHFERGHVDFKVVSGLDGLL
jgi:type III restriction enzyme